MGIANSCLRRVAVLAVCFAVVAVCEVRAQTDPFLSLFEPRSGAEPLTHDGAALDQEFLRVEAQHARVGVLQNDIRGTGLVNSDRVVIPRGTALYYAAFGRAEEMYAPGQHREGWCGVVTERNRPRGYCMFADGDGAVLGLLPGDGSFYAPLRLADYGLRPITRPQVQDDPTARSQLPEVLLSYSVHAWRSDEVEIERAALIDHQVVNLGSYRLRRNAEGAVELRVGLTTYVLSPGADGRTVMVREQ